jgi:type IV pilus assembly protein PilM
MQVVSRLLRRPASLVGVDIGSSAVKAVELTQSATGQVAVRAGLQPVPPESIAKGTITDGATVAEALRGLLEATGIRGRKVALSLPGGAVVAREISMPRMTSAELAGSIGWEAERHIPFELSDVNLDYQVVGREDDSDGPPTMIVLLAAAKKSTVAQYAAVIEQAGCVPAIVDVAAFALQNAYAVFGGRDGAGSAALLNAGASTINVNIVVDGRSVFTRDIAIGGNAYTDALRVARSLSFGEAEELKKGGEDGRNPNASELAVREVTERLLLEIEKTVDFFAASQASARLDHIVLSGGASRGGEFSAAIADRFDASLERFDPFRSMTIGGVNTAGGELADVAAAAGVATGLALRSMGDR